MAIPSKSPSNRTLVSAITRTELFLTTRPEGRLDAPARRLALATPMAMRHGVMANLELASRSRPVQTAVSTCRYCGPHENFVLYTHYTVNSETAHRAHRLTPSIRSRIHPLTHPSHPPYPVLSHGMCTHTETRAVIGRRALTQLAERSVSMWKQAVGPGASAPIPPAESRPHEYPPGALKSTC